MIKNARDHHKDHEQGACKMQADCNHDKTCACDLEASTCTRVSEWHCTLILAAM